MIYCKKHMDVDFLYAVSQLRLTLNEVIASMQRNMT